VDRRLGEQAEREAHHGGTYGGWRRFARARGALRPFYRGMDVDKWFAHTSRRRRGHEMGHAMGETTCVGGGQWRKAARRPTGGSTPRGTIQGTHERHTREVFGVAHGPRVTGGPRHAHTASYGYGPMWR
jgi:hypothetical protein